MTYKQVIISAMNKLARDKRTVFIGYNTACGSRMYGTLAKVPLKQCVETPVAENLMVGLGMGMSLEGYRPIICFERANFLWTAADAIRHHLCMLPELSGWQFTFPVVLRVIEGHDRPLDPGKQHKWGSAIEFAKMCNMEYWACSTVEELQWAYYSLSKLDNPVMIIEYKRLY